LEIGQKRCRSAFTFSRSASLASVVTSTSIRCHIDQKTVFWKRHFDFLKQLCAAAVESRLGVDRHGFELDAVPLRAFVTDDVGAGDQCRQAHNRTFECAS
jgi:hypothetical protein